MRQQLKVHGKAKCQHCLGTPSRLCVPIASVLLWFPVCSLAWKAACSLWASRTLEYLHVGV